MARLKMGLAVAGIAGIVAVVLLVSLFFLGKWQDKGEAAVAAAPGGAPDLLNDGRHFVGMTKEELAEVLGYPKEEHAISRDFAEPHEEKPEDPSTWEEVRFWRFDYGVEEGYRVESDSFGQEVGFDIPALENGKVEAQIVVLFRGETVNRITCKYIGDDGVLTGYQLGPAVEDTEPTPSEESKEDREPLVSEIGSAYA